MLIQAFWYYTLLHYRNYSKYQVWQCQDLCFSTELKIKNQNQKTSKQTGKTKNHKQTNTKGNDNKKPTHTKNKQLFSYHLAHPV